VRREEGRAEGREEEGREKGREREEGREEERKGGREGEDSEKKKTPYKFQSVYKSAQTTKISNFV
jgi:hypothetical protein